MATGQLFYDPIPRPLSSLGVSLPGAYYNFYVSGTTTPAQVYQDAGLTLPYPAASLNGSSPLYTVLQADGTGAFTPIFLNPETIYRVQLYNSTWSLIEDVDPYVPAMPTTGNGQIALDAQGEMTINACSWRLGHHAHRQRARWWHCAGADRIRCRCTRPDRKHHRARRIADRYVHGHQQAGLRYNCADEVATDHLRRHDVLHPALAIT